MSKVWLVAQREYWYNLRRRSFLFAVFGVPLFTFVIWFIVFAVVIKNEEDVGQVGKVGYVDAAGILGDAVIPTDSADLFTAYPNDEAARKALDDKEVGAYFKVTEDYMSTGNVEMYSYSSVPSALEGKVDAFLLANLSRKLEGVPLDRIKQPVDLVVHINDSGRDITEANFPALFFIPLIFAMVFIMASGTTSGFLMNGIVEEKTNRIMEILITSVTPLQILLGKIIGLGALGLTQLVVWGVSAGLLIRFGQAIPALNGISFPTDLVIVFLIYFLLSYFLLSSLMAGLGAIAGSEQESRQYSSIISLLFVIPFFFITSFLNDPNGTLPLVLTMIPFTAPLTVLLRLGFSSVPTWQLIASIVILLLTSLVIVWASARVFRWGLLMYGKRPTPREIWHVIRSSNRAPDTKVKVTQERVS